MMSAYKRIERAGALLLSPGIELNGSQWEEVQPAMLGHHVLQHLALSVFPVVCNHRICDLCVYTQRTRAFLRHI